MALDGMIIAALTDELQRRLKGGRISKVAMPEKDEILLHIKNNGTTEKLLISGGASLPLMYITEETKISPLTAPAFCMLLRKHIGGAEILNITQSGLERIIRIDLEGRNELGDLRKEKLYVELMGKYSNIIFTDEEDTIIDSIKRIPATLSSLREVLPGKKYFIPEELKKINPLGITELSLSSSASVSKSLSSTFEGISNTMAEEICFRADIDSQRTVNDLSSLEQENVKKVFLSFMNKIKSRDFSPVLISRHGIPQDFSAFELSIFESNEYQIAEYDSISRLLEDYYASKDLYTRMRQKTSDLRKITVNALERASKKLSLQEKQLKDCAEKEKYKVYGDLINTYSYSLKGGEKELICENYYDNNNEIKIPLDVTKSPSDNANRYYNRYQKLRRTEIALKDELTKTRNDIYQLENILVSLDIASNESDLVQIKDELRDFGYIKRQNTDKKNHNKSGKPLEYISSDGFRIFVGKNNYQNEEVTFKIATGNDIWFHAKGVPGSHVIVKNPDNIPLEDLPDSLFKEAAGLAAYYSSVKNSDKVEIDYIQKKNIKKVAGAMPGYVIYHTNYSLVSKPQDLPCKV